MPSVFIDLVTIRPFVLPHRKMPAGETLARAEFRDEKDRDFFVGQLRWNAFKCLPVVPTSDPVPEPQEPQHRNRR